MPKMPKTAGGATPMRIESPLVIMFQDDAKNVITHIHPPKGWTHSHYGLLICDLVRHVAGALKVPEQSVWEWIEAEREKPTTDIKNPS